MSIFVSIHIYIKITVHLSFYSFFSSYFHAKSMHTHTSNPFTYFLTKFSSFNCLSLSYCLYVYVCLFVCMYETCTVSHVYLIVFVCSHTFYSSRSLFCHFFCTYASNTSTSYIYTVLYFFWVKKSILYVHYYNCFFLSLV